MHVNVVLPVEVAVLLPADAAQQEAVCKREGDVRDRDEQQDKGKHCGILTTKVDATETERKEDLGRPRYESGLALFDISISDIDCRYIDTFKKYRYRQGHSGKYRYR